MNAVQKLANLVLHELPDRSSKNIGKSLVNYCSRDSNTARIFCIELLPEMKNGFTIRWFIIEYVIVNLYLFIYLFLFNNYVYLLKLQKFKQMLDGIFNGIIVSNGISYSFASTQMSTLMRKLCFHLMWRNKLLDNLTMELKIHNVYKMYKFST